MPAGFPRKPGSGVGRFGLVFLAAFGLVFFAGGLVFLTVQIATFRLIIGRSWHGTQRLTTGGLVLVIDHAKIVFRMLIIILGRDSVALRRRIARHTKVFFEDLMSITANADIRAVAVISLIS